MIPSTTCERCGAEEPTEVVMLSTAEAEMSGGDVRRDGWSICRGCRKSFRRWMKRPTRKDTGGVTVHMSPPEPERVFIPVPVEGPRRMG